MVGRGVSESQREKTGEPRSSRLPKKNIFLFEPKNARRGLKSLQAFVVNPCRIKLAAEPGATSVQLDVLFLSFAFRSVTRHRPGFLIRLLATPPYGILRFPLSFSLSLSFTRSLARSLALALSLSLSLSLLFFPLSLASYLSEVVRLRTENAVLRVPKGGMERMVTEDSVVLRVPKGNMERMVTEESRMSTCSTRLKHQQNFSAAIMKQHQEGVGGGGWRFLPVWRWGISEPDARHLMVTQVVRAVSTSSLQRVMTCVATLAVPRLIFDVGHFLFAFDSRDVGFITFFFPTKARETSPGCRSFLARRSGR